MTFTPKTHFDKPWMTNGIRKSITVRYKLYKALKKDPNNLERREKYTKYRNSLTKIMRRAEADFNFNTIQSANGDQAKMWKAMNEILGRKRKNTSPIPPKIIDEHGNELTKPVKIDLWY